MEINQVLTIIISMVGIFIAIIVGFIAIIFSVLRGDIRKTEQRLLGNMTELHGEVNELHGEVKELRGEVNELRSDMQKTEDKMLTLIEQSESRQDKLRKAELKPITMQVFNHIPTQIRELQKQVTGLRDVVIPTQVGELHNEIKELRDVVIPTQVGELHNEIRELRNIVVEYIAKDSKRFSNEPQQPSEEMPNKNRPKSNDDVSA